MSEPERSTFVRVESGLPDPGAPRVSTDAGDPAPAQPPARADVAVILTHGMGQQVRFETLEGVANALRDAERRGAPAGAGDVVVRRVPGIEPELFRAELTLRDGTCVHLYEAYWAPLTEGRIGIAETLRFLVDGARMGLHRSVLGGFRRLMFNDWQHFSVGPTTALMLWMALGLIATWVVVGLTIAVTVVSRLASGLLPGWPPPQLLGALTAAWTALLGATASTGLGVALAAMPRRRRADGSMVLPPMPVRVLSWGLVSLGGLAMLAIGVRVVGELLVAAGATWSASPRAIVVTAVAAVMAVVFGGAFARRLHRARVARLERGEHPDVSLAERVSLTTVFAGHAAIAAAAAAALWRFDLPALALPAAASSPLVVLAVWSVMALLVAGLQTFLIEYVGDVAIYVSAHTVSRFQETRDAIQRASLAVAEAVYGMHAEDGPRYRYDRVVVAGHSLGSVVAYDTLNALIRRRPELDASRRTALLLTFGSPLDKTAFIFRNQRSEDSDVREGLAQAVQPMISEDRARPARWVNLWSRNDPISGSLEYYDREGAHANRSARHIVDGHPVIENHIDPEATTPLLAHNEYWGGQALTAWLMAGVCGQAPQPPDGGTH